MKKGFKVIIDTQRAIAVQVESEYTATVVDLNGNTSSNYTLNCEESNNAIIEDTIKMVDYVHSMMAVKEGTQSVTIDIDSTSESEVDKDYIMIATSLADIFKGEVGVRESNSLVSSGYNTLQKYLGY